MNLRSNESYKAVVAEIEAAGGTFNTEYGKKHCIIRYQVGDFKGMTVVGYGSYTNWRAHKNARSEVRRALRMAGVLKDDTPEVIEPEVEPQDQEEINTVSALQLSEHEIVEIDGELRMRDLDVGDALGFTRLNNIRNLIESNRHELAIYGHLAESELRQSDKGGRPSRSYLLNREQCLLVAMFSRTPRAAEVRHQIIKAYTDWEQHHAPAQEVQVIEKPAEPELLANDAAIEMLVDRFAKQLIGVSATQTTTKVEFPADLVTRKDFEGVMLRYFTWMKAELKGLKEAQGPSAMSSATLEGAVDKVLSKRIGLSNQIILAEVQKRSGDTEKLLAESLASVARSINAVQETQDRMRVKLDGIESIAPQAAAEDVEAPAHDEVYEEEAESDLPIAPAIEPLSGELDALVAVSDVYAMSGLNPDSIGRKRSLSMSMRFSIEEFARRRNIKPRLFAFSGQYRQQWPRDMVALWYKDQGRDMILRHMRAIA